MSPPADADVASTRDVATNDTFEQDSHLDNDGREKSPSGADNPYDNTDRDDPATTAASENLKHASISDNGPLETNALSRPILVEPTSNIEDLHPPKSMTPERSYAHDDEMIESISSPKKKRGREYEDAREAEEDEKEGRERIPSNGSAVNGRTTRLAPEKKRYRDASEDSSVVMQGLSDTQVTKILDPDLAIVLILCTGGNHTRHWRW